MTRPASRMRLRPKPVTEQAQGEQQPGEDQGVGVDRPLQLALGGAQILLDGLEGDVEDGVVEDDDQQADDKDAEDRPATRVAGLLLLDLGFQKIPPE